MPATIISKAQLEAMMPPVDDPPIALAKEAIVLLEQRMKTEFGVRPQFGAELEFATQSRIKMPLKIKRPENIKSARRPIASIQQTKHKRDPVFPNSPVVAYTYIELCADSGWGTWEVLLTHQPVRGDGTVRPSGGLEIARAIEALKFQLCHPKSGYKNGWRSVAVTKWQDFLEKADSKAVIQGSISDYTTLGLHLNGNLVDIQNGVSLSMGDGNYLQYLLHGLKQQFVESHYLLGTSDPSIQRMHSRAYNLSFLNGCNRYIENTLPHADSNPYYVAMLELAGIYRGLYAHRAGAQQADSALEANESSKKKECDNRATATAKTLKSQFEQSHLLRDTLNDLRTGLGDEFYAAIEKLPPGKEQSAVAKMHAMRGELPHTSQRIRY
jgi:hypothetical protein